MFDRLLQSIPEAKLSHRPQLVIENSLARDMDDLVKETLPGLKPAIVNDINTNQALGERLSKALAPLSVPPVTFERPPSADDASVEYVRKQSQKADVLVAVGSGTINDICKYAAFLDGKPYIVFPTAASMNGYLSANASISVKGYKKTLAAKMPLAVLCDMSVIAAAPARLNKSGFGDTLARSTAQTDWLLSHLLLGTPYDDTPFTLLAEHEPPLFGHARGIALSDGDSVRLLMQVLLLSGLGMTAAGGSYPASQAEHMVAHTYNMLTAGRHHATTFHGEEVGVTTLDMARLHERLLQKPPTFKPDDFDAKKMETLFGVQAAQEAKRAFAAKQAMVSRATLSAAGWDKICQRLETSRLPPQRIESLLKESQAPLAVEELGWDRQDYATATAHARYLRDRFTCLDLIPA